MLTPLEVKFIAALRSGKYKQSKYQLRQLLEQGHCCLGIACDISGLGFWDPKHLDIYLIPTEDESYTIEAEAALPSPVRQALDWRDDAGRLTFLDRADEPMYLTTLNDDYDVTFPQIADLIEAGLIVKR